MGAADPHSSFNALLPEQFGKYSLLGHLATGGMAEVWLARQLGMQGFEKIVVIKRARPELTDVETTEFFLDEARLVATLEHPNIAQVYEIGFVNGSYFFVMEYVDGADLRRLIETALSRQRWIPLGDALYIITHVCTALHYAHEKKDLEGRALHIIHRDVSPSNVLISHDGAIKVCDFGIAKAHNRKSEDTQSGVLKGKFSYMSPEQCQSQPIDRRSDVFSIGILLYELTTLSKLFRGGSDYALLRKIIDGPIPPPSTRVSGYPRELEAIVMKALAKSPSDRYPTAQALQLDLEAFAREHKLMMSSIGIAKLMGELFERRNDAWIRAQRAHSDHFIVAGEAGGSGNLPAFLAVGSAPSATTEEAVLDNGVPVPHLPGNGRSHPVSMSTTVQTGQSGASLKPATRRRRTTALLLVGAVAAAVFAIGVTVANQVVVKAGDRAAVSALNSDVERITSTFDATARSAHMRADGIATTPMLRAAIETDAATLSDLANTEMIFTAGKGEALEVFQFRSDKSVSLLRIPKTVKALPVLKGRETRLRIDGNAVTMYASAPISGYRAELVGGLVISVPVDLLPLKRALEEHAVRATLTGLGTDLPLVGSGTSPPAGPAAAAETPIKLAVPSGGEWNAGSAMLVATPKRAGGLSWAAPVRNLSGGLGVLLLIGFIVSLVRRPRA
ncbi:MAG TPA: serine/threonine-protein kinase [Kofleriaceae bacterium]|nr:serine/threonine-protein kinase [Kofleriaceae bacterium]